MNTDERFNYYSEQMNALKGNQAAKRLETAMSQMLEMKCSEHLVWRYAVREIANAAGELAQAKAS